MGRETVLLLRAAGMDVDIVGRSARNDAQLGHISGFDDLDRLLGIVDDVVLTLPLTEETRGLFNSSRFKKMQPGARLVNVGRGAVVVEQDLLESLDSGRLGGAAWTSSSMSHWMPLIRCGAGGTSWSHLMPPGGT